MCWHDWSDWKTVKEGDLLRQGTQSVIGYGIIQERSCSKCQKKELNEQTKYI